jgi:hypothetical protein
LLIAVLLYPHRPHPKEAVNNILKITSPIIQKSSLFMV